jgi:hypothetical protein
MIPASDPKFVPGLGPASKGSRFGPRLKLLMVMLVCAAPVLASYFTYYVVRPEGRRNFGQLIDPQRPLPALDVLTRDGKTRSLQSLKGQWLLISVAGAACGVACEERLYLQRQLLTSLGKERSRLDWVWLVTDAQPIAESLSPALKDALVLRADPKALGTWLQAETGQAIEDHLYVVDPLGNWMMRFPANMDKAGAAKAKRDLDRLVRASASWDEPGREAGRDPSEKR